MSDVLDKSKTDIANNSMCFSCGHWVSRHKEGGKCTFKDCECILTETKASFKL